MAAVRHAASSGAGGGDTPRRAGHQLRLLGLFFAITGCFLVYSLIQERLMTLGFGPQHERFEFSLFIILVNRLVCCAVAAAALSLAGSTLRPTAPLTLFGVPSLANVLGSASQYEALKYVSFPLQALAKCAKTVPVMAWGLVLGGRRYDAIDYICAGTVTVGCALFVLTGSIAAPQLAAVTGGASSLAGGLGGPGEAGGGDGGDGGGGGGGEWMVYGLLLLAAFLLFDGLTSTTQDKLFAQYEMHSVNQLLWVSVWSTGISLVMLVAGNQLWPALVFVMRHPIALACILALALVSTAVQLFIFYTIQQYGALHFALIMTMRQFLSIILSCLVFSHDLSPAQWLGTLLVIGGLVARGMHRGSLARTSAKATNGMRKSASVGELLLPASVPVIDQAAGGRSAAAADAAAEEGRLLQHALLAAAAAKKVGEARIPVEVQAGALAGGTAEASRLALRRGSPLAGSTASVAARRKGTELG